MYYIMIHKFRVILYPTGFFKCGVLSHAQAWEKGEQEFKFIFMYNAALCVESVSSDWQKTTHERISRIIASAIHKN